MLLLSSTVFASGTGKLVLVMDDLGNRYQEGRVAVSSPWVTTVAIMPGRPYTAELAEYAHELGKEIIVHAPMSNSIDFPLGPMGLTREHGRQALTDTVVQSIENVPHAVGLSNHMGSRLTSDAEAMDWVMGTLKQHGFYFFDSRTTAETVGYLAAQRAQIPWGMRNFFLDHFKEQEFMASQWDKAVKRAESGEHVTVIAHPYAETLAFLSQMSHSSEKSELLVPLSNVLNYPTRLERSTRNEQQGT